MRICYTLILSMLLIGAGAVQAAEKWALLIGVGDYIHGTRLDLQGPAHDVQMMEELLLTKFGYQADHIRRLVDVEATKAKIVGMIRTWLIKRARPGDTVLLYYSGHGSQVADRSGDESDGRDEVLCPADVRVGVPGNEISDDELKKLLGQIQATDVTVIFDACHAGTGTRELEFEEPVQPLQYRAIDLEYPEPEGGQRELSFEAGEMDGMDLLAEAPPAGTRSLEGGQQAFTMIASCAPEETSASTVFYEGLTRFWSGVMTYNLIKALKKADGQTTYEELMAGVLRDVKRINRRQTPQVEGHTGRPIFSNTSEGLTTRSYIRVTRVEGKRAELRSSSFGREHPGSIYRVLSPDTGKPVGRIKITKVIGRTIDGEVIDGEGKIRAPALAVEEFHAASGEKLHVRMADFGDIQINLAMRQRLEKLDFVWAVRSDTAYADMVLNGRIEGSVISLLTGYEITAWLEEAGVKSREVTSTNVDEIMGVLRPLLENAYAIKKLSRLDNDSPPFKVSVWATGAPDPGKKPEKFAEMKVGAPVYFHFRSDRDAYLTLLNVGAEGSITILFPNEYMPFNRVVAGKIYTIPTPEMGFQLHMGGPPGQELVKAFATEFPLDLSALNPQAVGGFRALEFEGDDTGYGPSVVDGLSAALGASFSDNIAPDTRAIMLSAAPEEEGPPPGTPTENWSTDYLIIEAR